jgi:hypothetical protein
MSIASLHPSYALGYTSVSLSKKLNPVVEARVNRRKRIEFNCNSVFG